jgi:hypothetical protein
MESKMSKSKFASAAESRKAKWFSRRHETSQPHFESKQRYQDRQTEKFQNAQERIAQADAKRAKVVS